jgi:hypothetical protein
VVKSLQDGAESGYGAKAQEILGQVRGRYVLLYAIYICVFVREHHSTVEVKAASILFCYYHCWEPNHRLNF